jgi:tRNA-specific adenosine deaminase 2
MDPLKPLNSSALAINSPKMTEEERQLHLSFMREALAMVPLFPPSTSLPKFYFSISNIKLQAELALTTNETPVGCVFVHNNIIIGRGMNATNQTFNGTRHAEFIAINNILAPPPSSDLNGKEKRKYGPEILRECDLYVTVEPCIMCASLLRQFGVRRVFFGAGNEKFGGTGGVLNVHVSNGAPELDGSVGNEEMEEERRKRHEDDYEVSGGWLREEAIVMLRRFYVQENGRAPEPKGKKERVLKLEVEPSVEDKQGGDG